MLFQLNLFVLTQLLLTFHFSNGKIYKFELGNKLISIKSTSKLAEAKIQSTTNECEGVIAISHLQPQINETGWNNLEVWGNPYCSDSLVANAAGLVEGIVSASYIFEHWYNTRKFYCEKKEHICEKINDFILQNYNYTHEQIYAQKNTSGYWYQVYLYHLQVQGIYDGYEMMRNLTDLPNISFTEILLMNFEGDLFDLLDKYQNSTRPTKLYDEGHCSAIIKLLPGNKDLYMAHNSWFRYYAMHRMLKKYMLKYHELPGSRERIPGHTVTFSSYPAKIHSFDDYYLISSGLAVQETTIGNSNNDLWKYVQPNSVLESVRIVVANRLAKNGKSWSEIFKKYNSGTYNNQWMVVDYKKFKKGKSPKKGLLWILEQIPHYVTAADQTHILIKKSYWPSYNIPFYKNIFKLNGNDELVKKYGDWYSYSRAPRAKIMKRDHKKIKNLDSLMAFMRYNDYKHDPYSRCNCTPPYTASAAIASRHDLNPANGSYPLPMLGHREGGAYDAKLTSSKLMEDLNFIAVSGPSAGTNLPIFKWSTSGFADSVPHLGQPDEWNFNPVTTNWDF